MDLATTHTKYENIFLSNVEDILEVSRVIQTNFQKRKNLLKEKIFWSHQTCDPCEPESIIVLCSTVYVIVCCFGNILLLLLLLA